ncbi:CML14 [Symbiodinium pilosum]|uniref:CML14 protein n=1 Tax=Symbiodinium pilosum TaxID=2952 RepID=A0A812YCC0_SYMPI|nr:CML14 [Symbiodinium pilosum]
MSAAVVAQKVAELRDDAQNIAQEQRNETVREIFERLDDNGSGSLDRSEVRSLLQQLNKGQQPTEEELTFVMKMAGGDGSVQPGKARADTRSLEIGRDNLMSAVTCWRIYQSSFADDKSMGVILFKKFDPEGTGKLDRKQLKALLEELSAESAEEEVTEEDLDFVLDRADILRDGTISKMELNQAIAAWYQRQNLKMSERATTSQRSSVCAIL